VEEMGFIVGSAGTICLIAMLLTVFRDIGIDVLFNFDAFLIVVGGTVAALFIGFPFGRVKATFTDVVDTFRNGRTKKDTVKEILEIAREHRKGDLRKLEKIMMTTADPFLKLGVSLLVNRYRKEEIRKTMERDMAGKVVSLNLSQNVLMTMARLTPSFGLAGTVLSLIKIFKHFSSFETIIPVMAIALMSTFYGVVLSNLILLPLSAKMKERAIMSEELMQIAMAGIMEVGRGEHPLKIEEKLLGYDAGTDVVDTNNAAALRAVKS
jgi:chemotaxis protein MotA